MKRISLLFVILLASAAIAQNQPADPGGFSPIHGKVRRERVAVPSFRGDPQAAGLITTSLRDGFEMLGLCELVDPASYPDLSVPGTAGDLSAFRMLRAEYVVTGTVTRVDSGRYQVEIIANSLSQNKMVLGKRYTGGTDILNRMALKYLDEFLNYLTGQPGALDSRIAFISQVPRKATTQLHLMDSDGRHDILLNPALGHYLSPDWSADGRFITYVNYIRRTSNGIVRNPDLYIADLGNQKVMRLYDGEGTNSNPRWSPDGRAIVFSKQEGEGMDLFLITVPGRDLRRLTASRGDEVSPTWSPDGRYIAFVSNRGGAPQIYLLDLTRGSEGAANPAVRLTEGARAEYPAWSPDGRFIAYSGMSGGQYDLFLIDMAGNRGARRITASGANEEKPSWSGDSRFLAYASNAPGNYDIYITSIYGGKPRKITSSGSKDYMPAWSPKQN